ncbi:MAG: SDR family NAD(P)-dependent oxidoreductase [Candidatus Poribacteria bacterium]|nr:SDR family NAD(P)-dependent oxidoreductase [Candidatus Poribacteria bacterium]
MSLFHGKTAVITGGSSGIGEGFAHFLIEEGASVAIVARQPDKLARVADALRAKAGEGQSVLAVSADVTRDDAVERMKSEALGAFGHVDILVNSAGVGIWQTIDQMSPNDWRAVIDINLNAVFLVTHAFLPGMLARQTGHIVNISSVAGKLGFAYGSSYCASKWGLLGFTRALAAEVRDKGIRVDTLCPGTVETPFKNSPAASPIRLEVDDVIAAARYVMTLPRQVRVDDLVIYPT